VQSEDAAQIRCSEELLERGEAVDGDGAGAQSGSTLIEEREGDLRCGARIVEPSDTQVEARRSALRLSCVQPNDRGWDGERGWLGHRA